MNFILNIWIIIINQEIQMILYEFQLLINKILFLFIHHNFLVSRFGFQILTQFFQCFGLFGIKKLEEKIGP
jgi:hypothetical protein